MIVSLVILRYRWRFVMWYLRDRHLFFLHLPPLFTIRCAIYRLPVDVIWVCVGYHFLCNMDERWKFSLIMTLVFQSSHELIHLERGIYFCSSSPTVLVVAKYVHLYHLLILRGFHELCTYMCLCYVVENCIYVVTQCHIFLHALHVSLLHGLVLLS